MDSVSAPSQPSSPILDLRPNCISSLFQDLHQKKIPFELFDANWVLIGTLGKASVGGKGTSEKKSGKEWLPLPYTTFTNSQIPFIYPPYHATKEYTGDDDAYSDIDDEYTEAKSVNERCICFDEDDDDANDAEEVVEEEEEEEEEEGISEAALPIEQRLMNKLLRRYERAVRPVKNASDTVVVKMGMTLTQIFDLDEKNEVLVTNVWLDQEWDDMFLSWNPEDFGGLEVLRLPCHKLWLPDIVLYNNAAEYTDGMFPANAMITHEGGVFWPVPTKLLSSCKVDVTYFPFDDQKCRLKFGSWTYDGFQVDMTNRTVDIDLSNYIANGEWELISIVIERNVVYYACCAEPFPDVTFTIHIRRRTVYYLYNVIFPCVMMSTLTVLVFCLPPDSGEKITMGITVLLAFSVFLLRMGEDLPETSEFIPLLSIYLTIVMGMTSVSVIMTVFVLNLHHRGPNNTPVPPWLHKVFLSRLKDTHNVVFKQNSLYDDFFPSGTSQSRFSRNHLTIENLAQELKHELDTQYAREHDSSPNDKYESDTTQFESSPDHSSTLDQQPACSTTQHILRALYKIVHRYEREDNEEHRVYEWRQLAVIVDRILFWIFLTGTLSSTIIVLIIAPLIRWL
ncbi:hypothetical protein CAPTEDRAFT_204309 [Capitella teleta]|uniref:Uncharacterized protein n=1 Tax=Capitella teleta TaxID=283909 RepID=R7V7D5_CAPTE|nr:hypothetical protein CAPTEDRAFT_204309 [Capitella teleta]|eukprot:ELU14382.1 hypothetical protein CAPTEDRAFT_204309 [Capitella teleta]